MEHRLEILGNDVAVLSPNSAGWTLKQCYNLEAGLLLMETSVFALKSGFAKKPTALYSIFYLLHLIITILLRQVLVYLILDEGAQSQRDGDLLRVPS